MKRTDTPARVALLVFPETSASVVYGMYDMLMCAGRDWGLVTEGRPGPQLIQPILVGRSLEAVTTGNGVRIVPHESMSGCALPEVVCVPELTVPPGEPLDGLFTEEIDWVARCHGQGAMIATACSGAMLLAEAGLLDGHEATTHWAYCDILKRRYPRVTVHPQRALVVSGDGHRLMMAGGGTSWLDMTLYLIARLTGIEAAMQVARLNLIDWHAIGQQPFARLARSRQVEDAAIARSQAWIAEHYRQASPVAAMARLSGLSERSFKRRFEQATGMAPLEYVHTLRMEEAKQMLETTELPVEAIANEVGYEDAGFFSRLFRRSVNLTPAQYRKRFSSMRRALQASA